MDQYKQRARSSVYWMQQVKYKHLHIPETEEMATQAHKDYPENFKFFTILLITI
ncbi:predicted protein [Sclerotinia sclerotiorum 1980 UF-70]|uniref:Uncharacterized protein n=1 Tax=Sclerotinia sclerotiorum (strain ATCC 18683 / 1980 / Ss-1) TaxID=665079 RepID=A7F4I9_SCLS1|nr:predicted protein [Sclerotinia sclerotiorum 1980 UF-70]EDN97660.1 predicted protein [Sclerotinia sclerotiorum 1980 UF-70]